MLDTIKKTIETEINPVLALHNGGCEALKFENKTLTVKLTGGCVGCPSSKITLLKGVMPILTEKHPEIEEVTLEL